MFSKISRNLGKKLILSSMIKLSLMAGLSMSQSAMAQSIDSIRFNDSTPQVNQSVRIYVRTSGLGNSPAIGLRVIKPGENRFTTITEMVFTVGARGTDYIDFTPQKLGTYTIEIRAARGGRAHGTYITRRTRLMVNDGRVAGENRIERGQLVLSQYSGTRTQVSLNTTGGSSALVYQFQYRQTTHNPNPGYHLLQNFGTDNTAIFSRSNGRVVEIRGSVRESAGNGGPLHRTLFFSNHRDSAQDARLAMTGKRRVNMPIRLRASSDSAVSFRYFIVSPNSTQIRWLNKEADGSAIARIPSEGYWLIGTEARDSRGRIYWDVKRVYITDYKAFLLKQNENAKKPGLKIRVNLGRSSIDINP